MDREKIKSLLGQAILRVNEVVPDFEDLDKVLPLLRQSIDELDKFLDDAKFSRLPMVRIVHGDGTGALRKAVHERLRNDSSVKEFRLGMPNEGGTGATIVTL